MKLLTLIIFLLLLFMVMLDRYFWHPAEHALVRMNEAVEMVKEVKQENAVLRQRVRNDSLDLFWLSEKYGLLESFWFQQLGWSNKGMRIGLEYTACREMLDNKYLKVKGLFK